MNGYPTVIVWDLDGTLIDSALDLAQALNRQLREHGRAGLDENLVRTMIGDGVAKLIEWGFAAGGHRMCGPELEDLIPRFMTIYSACATDNTRLYAGAQQVLEHFSNAGVRQGICTNKPEGVTRQILSDLSIADYFGAVIGGDTTPAKKPDPLPLISCLDALNATHEQSIFIGDTGVDVATARAAGIPIGIVTFGYARKAVTDLAADFLIDNLDTMPMFINELRAAG